MTEVAILLEQHWNAVPGGTARSVSRLVDAIAADGRVTVTGVHGRHTRPPVLALPPVELVELPVPGRLLNQTWNRWGQPGVDRLLGDVDVVHGPAYLFPATNSPVVVTVHDLAFVRHPEWFTANGRRYLGQFLDRVAASPCPVIVPSDHTATDCVAEGIDESRLHVIPWGIDVVEFSDDEVAAVTDRHRLPDRYVVFVGTLEPRKNLHGLAAAMARLPDLPLVVVGPAGWGDAGLSVPHHRLDGLDRRELDAVIAGATVLVYPSFFEGFGLPVLEAMSVGTPVVVTEGTAPAELASDAGIATDTSSPTRLAEAIDAIAGSDALARQYADAGRQRALGFSWSNAVDRTVAVYEQAARG